ncbi:MAG TPA: P83/100 family protein [Treponemataceae bacterium]|nr:P83/100 family protein [Treponemataceae bacterium]
MKKFAVAVLASSMCLAAGFSLEVDRNEIAPGQNDPAIEFINYTGPSATVSTAAEIRGIGSALSGAAVQTGTGGAVTAGNRSRYFLIHAVDPSAATGLDADILVIGADATVDHIDNIRRILSGYLSAAYGYTEKDAATLATFVTIYNAVYRGKIDIFKARYKPVVTGYLTAESVGLSVRYSDWPGKTQIVIPLSDPRLAGTISSINTTLLTDKAVVDKIREDGGDGTQLRKDMVEFKEDERDAAQKRAALAQEEAAAARAVEQQKKLEAEAAGREAEKARKDAETAKKEADKAARDAEAAQQKAAASPEDVQAQNEAAEKEKQAAEKAQTASGKQESAEQKSRAADSKATEAQQAKETVTRKEAEAAADQTLADTKQKEAATERKEIATDVQKEVHRQEAEKKAAEQSALASSVPGYILRVVDGQSFVSELVLVNLNDGTEMKRSSLSLIRNRTIIDSGAGLIAIAGKKGGNAAVRLVLIDPNTLEMTAQGQDNIAESSMLIKSGNDYYAVIEQGSGSFVLGRFDANLAVKAKSSIAVQPFTAIQATDKGILVQDTSGKIVLLKASDLTQAK